MTIPSSDSGPDQGNSNEFGQSAPTRVCPHCHAQSETTAAKCPHCGKKFKGRGFASKFAMFTLVTLIVLGVLIAGCAALIGGAANEVVKEADKHAITKAEFAAVKTGETRAALEKRLGEPADTQEMDIDTSDFEGAGATQSNDCVYYSKKGDVIPTYQFCFTDDKLTTKSSY